MNQRLKRKIEKRRRQKICEALDLCLQINGLQASDREYTGDHLQCSMTWRARCLDICENLRKRMGSETESGQRVKGWNHLPK